MKYIGVDIESIGLNPYDGTVWMLSITEGKSTKVYHNCNGMSKKDIPASVVKLLEDESVCKIIHSSMFDMPYVFMNLGVRLRNIWDTDLCEIVIQGIKLNIKKKSIKVGSPEERLLKQHGTALKEVLPRYGFPEPNKSIREAFINRPKGKKFTKQEIDYAADDTRYLLQLQKAQEYLLTRDGLMEVALLENKVAERYHDMKIRGILIDQRVWRDVAMENMKELDRRMRKLPKDVQNWNSDKQVKTYFRKKGIMIPTYDELDDIYLQTRNKTLGDFIATRELQKAVTAYGLSWFKDGYIDPDGRVRTHITQIINTGRNAMSDPNLQQLPGTGNNDPLRLRVLEEVLQTKKKKPQHRRAFIPKPGCVFVRGDFSGQEIGIMASASGEDLWINALLRGEDVHGLTASVINIAEWRSGADKGCKFPKKCECPGHKKLREPAKINNFMLAYGGGAGKLAAFLGWPMIKAVQFVGAHKRVTPRLTNYLKRNAANAVATGVSYSADPYKRRRVLRGEEKWQIENQGKNNPIQSAGANMLKLALVSIPWEYAVVLVIHDEIILEVPKAQAKKAAKMLKEVMSQAADYVSGIKGLIKVEPEIVMNLMKS